MREMDTVKLKKEFCDLPTGTVGIIIFKYNEECCEVEFFDKTYTSIDVITTPTEFLELIQC